jgi:hypothetical protein
VTLFFKEKYKEILHVCKSIESGIEAKDLKSRAVCKLGFGLRSIRFSVLDPARLWVLRRKVWMLID